MDEMLSAGRQVYSLKIIIYPKKVYDRQSTPTQNIGKRVT